MNLSRKDFLKFFGVGIVAPQIIVPKDVETITNNLDKPVICCDADFVAYYNGIGCDMVINQKSEVVDVGRQGWMSAEMDKQVWTVNTSFKTKKHFNEAIKQKSGEIKLYTDNTIISGDVVVKFIDYNWWCIDFIGVGALVEFQK